jgi:hypothetical protein
MDITLDDQAKISEIISRGGSPLHRKKTIVSFNDSYNV